MDFMKAIDLMYCERVSDVSNPNITQYRYNLKR